MSSTGWTLQAVPEWIAHDPFGKLKPADAAEGQCEVTDERGVVVLQAPRNGYVSFRLLVRGQGEYTLRGSADSGLEVDLFRAWYHRMVAEEGTPPCYYPDALVPLQEGDTLQLPEPGNRIEGQTVQEFWVDVFVPPVTGPGELSGRITLKSGSREAELRLLIRVLGTTVPGEPCVVMDHNSYGFSWLREMYPGVLGVPALGRAWTAVIELLHHHYRLVHEHRGLFHNLGLNHAGSFSPIYGPRAEGSGRDKTLAGWELHDEHLGPLLDGTALETAAPACPGPRRSSRPLASVYSCITPDWPASYLWWGEPGYQVEFTRGLRQFDEHYRRNGWTRTNIEFFFNHKKRYRWFEWDGDEPKYAKDDAYHVQMGRMWRSAVQGSPLKWVYRMDASWQMKNEFARLRGLVDFWVLGGFSRWYPEDIREVRERGDTVWWYGGTPSVADASSDVLQSVYKTWVRGFDGYCAWLTTSPGSDPWFNCDGAATGMIYPGERFGIPGPIPSIRLKLERNGIQDIDLLNQAASLRGALEETRQELAAEVPIQLWERPPTAACVLPPEEWDSRNLRTEIEPGTIPLPKLDPLWWTAIRRRAHAREGDR